MISRYALRVLQLCAIAFSAATIVWIVLNFAPAVEAMGVNIPQDNLFLDYVVGGFWALCLGSTILLWPVSATNRIWILYAWLARCGVTLGIMLFYERYYPDLDSYTYFDWATHSELFRSSYTSIINGTDLIVGLGWLQNHILPHSYHALKVTFSMAGLIGVYVLYRACVVVLDRESKVCFCVLAFFPSILFWSSTIGKDPLIFLGIAVFILGVIKWYYRPHTLNLVIPLLSVILVGLIRPWMGALLLSSFPMMAIWGRRSFFLKTVSLGIVGVALFFSVSYLKTIFAIETSEDLLLMSDRVARGFSSGGSGQEVSVNLRDPGEFIGYLPIAIFSALFRPLPSEVSSPFGVLAGLENVSVLVLFFVAVKRASLKDFGNPIVLWGIYLTLAWAAMYGVLTQNLGSAARFKLQILPVMLGVLLFLARKEGVMIVPGSRPRRVMSGHRRTVFAKGDRPA